MASSPRSHIAPTKSPKVSLFADLRSATDPPSCLREGDRWTRLRSLIRAGYTLLELVVVMAILATLSMIAVVELMPHLAQTRNDKAADDIRVLERAITRFLVENGHLPASLEEAITPVPVDPWGNPYQYLRIDSPAGGKGKGKGNGNGGGGDPGRGHWRKDRFLVPINSDYDLYSMGPDGRSSPPLTAQHSRDDIVRGGNGGFVGVASEY